MNKVIMSVAVLVLVAVPAAEAKTSAVTTRCGVINTAAGPVRLAPGSGVCVENPGLLKAEPGQKLSITLRVHGASRDAAAVVVSGQPGTLVRELSPMKRLQAGAVASDVALLPIEFTAENKGYFYIILATSSGNGDNRRTSMITLPVNVGKVNPRDYLQKNGTMMTAPSGRKVISLPAKQ